MKRIGLVGGLSWVSSVDYYRMINQLAGQRLGPKHSAQLALVNVDIGVFDDCLRNGDDDSASGLLSSAVESLEKAGAELVLLCSNGVHRFFERVEKKADVPLVHIADCVAGEMNRKGLKKAGLLGVRGTMEPGYYQMRLARAGIEVITPDEKDRKSVHDIIFEELIQEKFTEESRRVYIQIMEKMASRGAEATILGCTEIPRLIRPSDSSRPVLDTARLHAEQAVRLAFATT